MTSLLRPARADEAEAIAALVNSAYRGDSSRAGWTTEADLLGGQRTDPAAIRELLALPDHALLLAHDEGSGLVGCVLLERIDAARAYLGMLTVRPTRQAGGLGRRILEAAERHAHATWGTRELEMTVISQRTELIAWYERRGYALTGERRPFPQHDPRFGLPRTALEFVVLRRTIA